jgi:ribosomal-protein-alanine N-acetyltransferase
MNPMLPPAPNAAHIAQIMGVMNQAFDPLFGEAWTKAQVSSALCLPNCHYWLGNQRGENPANGETTTSFALTRTIADEAELLLLAVAPEWRGQGVAKRLLARAMDDIKTCGAQTMFLEVRAGNPALHLYQSQGFYPNGRRPKYYRCTNGERLDAITLARQLV